MSALAVPASAESLVACDYEGARLLAGREHGGGCENDADLACIDASVGFRLRPRSVGKWFLSCSAGTRCARGGLRLLADPLSLIAALHTKGATARPPGLVRVSRSSEESLFVLTPPGDHCANGQTLVVTVAEPAPLAPNGLYTYADVDQPALFPSAFPLFASRFAPYPGYFGPLASVSGQVSRLAARGRLDAEGSPHSD